MPLRSLPIRAAFVITLSLVSGAADRAAAQSWLQWGGPTRDFRVAANGLHWKGGTPRRVWQRDLGDGYSAVIGDASRLYVAFRRGDSLVASALDAATGRTQWERVLEGGPMPNMFLRYGTGPNATPALVGDRLFLPTFNGVFLALDTKSGKTIWTRELWRELKGTFRDVGYSSSPLVVRDRTILLDEDGRLALATLTPAGLRVLQQAPITTKLSWTVPTLIGTRLYVRDRKTLIALDLEQA